MQRRADIDGVASKYSFPKGAHAEKSCILPLSLPSLSLPSLDPTARTGYNPIL